MSSTKIGSYSFSSTHTREYLTHEEYGALGYAALVETIRSLYLWFAPGSSDEDIRQRLFRHPETQAGVLWNVDGECVGFSVYHTETVEGKRVMFRGGTVIRDRSRGLYKEVIAHGICEAQPEYLVAMTQNPRVYETLRSFAPMRWAYPYQKMSVPLPACIEKLARHFGTMPGFDIATLRAQGVYPEGLRKESSFKTARDPAITAMFRDELGANDAFLVVVDLGPPV